MNNKADDEQDLGAIRFTDAEAAQRLLDLHSRAVAKSIDEENVARAEYLMSQTARNFLKDIIRADNEYRALLRGQP